MHSIDAVEPQAAQPVSRRLAAPTFSIEDALKVEAAALKTRRTTANFIAASAVEQAEHVLAEG